MRVIKYIFIFILLLTSYGLTAQLSKIHYIPPLTTSPATVNGTNTFATVQRQYIYVSTPNQNPSKFQITTLDGNIWHEDLVSNSDPKKINLVNNDPYENLFIEDFNYEKILRKGFIIKSDTEVYISIRFEASSTNHAGAIVSKGESALGKRFFIGTLQHNDFRMTSFASVMATEDNTNVQYKLRNGIQTTGGKTNEFEIILNQPIDPLNVDYFYNYNEQDNLYKKIISILKI